MMAVNDTQWIKDQLETRFEDLVAHLYPGALKRAGCAYPTAKGPKETGSFKINLTGAHRGSWYRFSQDVGGGPLALIAYALRGDTAVTREVFDEARRFLGVDTRAISEEERQRREKESARRAAEADVKRKKAQEEEERAALKRQEDALALWEEGIALTGTPAELYLLNRGLHLPAWPAELRFLARCWHKEARAWSPALIARVVDVAGNFCGIWRIYITNDGRKAFGERYKIKLGLGPVGGGAVRLGGIGPKIGAAEGIETALAASVLNGGKYPVWSMLSTSGLTSFEPPFEVSRIVGWPDGDAPREQSDGTIRAGPGIIAMRTMRERMIEAGLKFTIQPPPANGDFLDLLNDIEGLL